MYDSTLSPTFMVQFPNMSDLIQALRPTVVNRTVTTNSDRLRDEKLMAVAEQIQAKEIPYCFLIHQNNKEAFINLNCQLLHIYHYIREKFAEGETSIGLVNADKATFLELKNQPGYAYSQLESKGTYLLVKVIPKNLNSNQDGEASSSVSQFNMNGGPPSSPGKKFDLEPLFTATEGDLQVLRQISSGKRRRPQQMMGHHEKNQSKNKYKK